MDKVPIEEWTRVTRVFIEEGSTLRDAVLRIQTAGASPLDLLRVIRAIESLDMARGQRRLAELGVVEYPYGRPIELVLEPGDPEFDEVFGSEGLFPRE